MNKKIKADNWFIAYHSIIEKQPFVVKIEYKLGDEDNAKSHRFATYREAYKWLENQVEL
jgi:hypothetical protein